MGEYTRGRIRSYATPGKIRSETGHGAHLQEGDFGGGDSLSFPLCSLWRSEFGLPCACKARFILVIILQHYSGSSVLPGCSGGSPGGGCWRLVWGQPWAGVGGSPGWGVGVGGARPHGATGSGSCHPEGQGPLRHKGGFNSARQKRSESRPRAGSQRAHPPCPGGKGALHPSAEPQALLGNETSRLSGRRGTWRRVTL